MNWGRVGNGREAIAPGNRRLPEFVLPLVGLRNRSKFRFALSSCFRASLVSELLCDIWSLTLHSTKGVAHLEVTSRRTLISVS